MNWLFGFKGRIGRGRFWAGFGVIVGLWLAAWIAFYFINQDALAQLVTWAQEQQGKEKPDFTNFPSFDPKGWILLGGTWLLTLWINLALMAKRFHDRGRTGALALVMVLGSYLGALIPFLNIIVGLGMFAWWLVDLGILEGEEGENRYGPDPRAA